jgi:hypothetical protein
MKPVGDGAKRVLIFVMLTFLNNAVLVISTDWPDARAR